MLTISQLSVTINNEPILNAINYVVKPGMIYALMGPNGSGKSSLAYTLMGHSAYTVTAGTINFNDVDITQLSADKRAQAGIFLAFQQPYEIPGVTVFNFLKEAYFACTKKMLTTKEFQDLLYSKMALLNIDISFAHRSLNCGFSGGEKKRLELLQLLILNPKIAILDEIDSGLDVDAIKIVAQGLELARSENPDLSLIIITHYPRLLAYLKPDMVHILYKGSIVHCADAALALEIEQRGYHAFELR